MRIRAMSGVIKETAERIAQDAPAPAQAVGAAPEKVAEAAVEALKQRADATFPGQFASAAVLAAREAHRVEALGSRRAFERTIGADDLVDLNYLIRGTAAARSVGRIAVRASGGHNLGDATGFLVSPSLLLTNWHVFQDGAEPLECWVEFDYELDLGGTPRTTTAFTLRPDLFYLEHRPLDYALVAVDAVARRGDGLRETYGWLRLNPAKAKILEGEPVTIVQHPEGLPKKIALRENRLLDLDDRPERRAFMTYESDTAPGSSGAPVFNNSWQVVGLHHSGVPRTDAAGNWLLRNGDIATDEDSDEEIDWVSNEGIRVSALVEDVLGRAPPGPVRDEFEACCMGHIPTPSAAPLERRSLPVTDPTSPRVAPHQAGAATFTVPLTITVSLGGAAAASVPAAVGPQMALGPETAVERNIEPWHDPDYSGREGYRPDFLGVEVAMPRLTDPSAAADMAGGSVFVPYENFSLVMHRRRRLPIFTAANVDFSVGAKEPEAGRDYGRKGLGGLGKNDREKWFPDPRLPANCQLPDRFFNNDRKAFDKGHLVRREEVCWGETYEAVRRANGDTYHATNCTPQVADFNQSKLDGIWGNLENLIEREGRIEKYCLFAGPVLADDDPVFVGVDDEGPIQVRIPRAYWKVIVAREGSKLEAFGFLLEQDLGRVAFEFDPDPQWRARMRPLKTIQEKVGLIAFPDALLDADQAIAGP